MPKTTADVPPVIAGDYAKLPRPDAVASAESDGYTKTPPMMKAQQPGSGSKQFGLPKSPTKSKPKPKPKMKIMPMKGR